jgi:hypothetical protein
MEIACDESGYEGEHHIGATTDVFAHASVHLDRNFAANSIREIRNRIRSPAQEYKSNHLLRSKHRAVLEWMLGPLGPAHGNAHVYLVDKAFFVAGKLVELLAGEGDQAGPMALVLYREGPGRFGPRRWDAFLRSFNDLLRANNRHGPPASVDSFFHVVDGLRRDAVGGRIGEILELLSRARPRAEALRARLLDQPNSSPAMDPLLPAIVRAVIHWSEGGEAVTVVHDQHTALTEERISQLERLLERTPGRFAGIRLVDSRSDPRVQVADFLAGVARKIASDDLNHHGDPILTDLLRPHLDPSSIWPAAHGSTLLGPYGEVSRGRSRG